MQVIYETREGVLRINAWNWTFSPKIEESEQAMAIVIDKLSQIKNIIRVVIAETKDSEYDLEQTKMLREIAEARDKILKEKKILTADNLVPRGYEKFFPKRLADLEFIILEVLRKDPIAAYIKINDIVGLAEKTAERVPTKDKILYTHYIEHALIPIREILGQTTLIKKVEPRLANYKVGDRTIYREFFSPSVHPNFMLTRYMLEIPENAISLKKYTIADDIKVEILRIPGKVRNFYHIVPQEFLLSEEKMVILDQARKILAAHKPTQGEITDPERTRELFANIGKQMIKDLAKRKSVTLSAQEIQELGEILSRYTAGFGVLEILLADENIQDIFINSPIGSTPIYVYHADFEECETNLIPSREDAEAWATRFRLYSGRPLDEANPVLDSELNVPGGRARVTSITQGLSPEGLAFALRRHRERPWTFPLFINNKYFDPLYSGLMSFIIDGGRAILVAGGRSSGKTSLLGAMMLEILRKFRILVQEDTLELPVLKMRQMGYNIERLKTRSVITNIQAELSADEALRTALRLGDSVLIVGEVRSVEARALFEAMRIGSLANVVAGTIHGESPFGVYDRVVNDLGVPPTSFKAIDLITVCNMLRSPDGLRRFRRVIEITEVRKSWKSDPSAENGFVKLMEYSAKEDRLKPTEVLLNGESEVLNEIAKRVREWHGSWDLVWDNINLRTNIKADLVKLATKLNKPEILEAEFAADSNEAFHIISQRVKEEQGSMDSKLIYQKWSDWVKSKIKGTTL